MLRGGKLCMAGTVVGKFVQSTIVDSEVCFKELPDSMSEHLRRATLIAATGYETTGKAGTETHH